MIFYKGYMYMIFYRATGFSVKDRYVSLTNQITVLQVDLKQCIAVLCWSYIECWKCSTHERVRLYNYYAFFYMNDTTRHQSEIK